MRYDTNFKLMAINHVEETNNCAVAQKFHVMEQKVQHRRKQK